jgi:hypothetical protein
MLSCTSNSYFTSSAISATWWSMLGTSVLFAWLI